MDIIVQLIVNGIIAGSIYALVASGFSLIYATNRFMHFAHGGVVVAGAYLLYTLFSLLNIPFFIAALLSCIGSAVLGMLMYVGVYRPLSKRGSSNAVLLIASVGMMILIENITLLLFGANVKTIGYLSLSSGINIFGAIVTPLQITIISITLLLLVALWIFTNKTKLGHTLRAVADNPELAQTSGINTHRIQLISFALGSSIAGLAGVLVALEQNIIPSMGLVLIIKGFTGAIIGGITSVPGAILGSYILGIVENLGILKLPSEFKDAIAFVLLFIFLLWRPTGILGINKGIKK